MEGADDHGRQIAYGERNTVDDLDEVIQGNRRSRKQAAEQAREIIDFQADEFIAWMRSLDAVDLIQDYEDTLLIRALKESGLTAYLGPPGGYVLEFTNGLTVYLSGDTGITAWLSNKKIVGVWSNASNKNSWINIQGLGWRRLFTGSETVVTCMTMLAAHARAENRNVNVRLEADNMIHEIYVW